MKMPHCVCKVASFNKTEVTIVVVRFTLKARHGSRLPIAALLTMLAMGWVAGFAP
jgi:hypothetical protein